MLFRLDCMQLYGECSMSSCDYKRVLCLFTELLLQRPDIAGSTLVILVHMANVVVWIRFRKLLYNILFLFWIACQISDSNSSFVLLRWNVEFDSFSFSLCFSFAIFFLSCFYQMVSPILNTLWIFLISFASQTFLTPKSINSKKFISFFYD